MPSQNRVVLSDRQLTALRLRLDGLTYKQIGNTMGCSEASAWQFVRRGWKNIERARVMEARLVRFL